MRSWPTRARVDAALFERLQAERDQLFRTADDLHTEWDVACHERVNTMLLAEEKIEEARFAQGILVGKGLLLFPLIRWILGVQRV